MATTKSVDYLDPTLMTKTGNSVCLPQVVAAGRLFILNGRGEYEKIEIASFWREDDLLSVCADGYEFNEDGDVTRVFQDGEK